MNSDHSCTLYMFTTFAEEAARVVFGLVLWVVTEVSDTATERDASQPSTVRKVGVSVANYKNELGALRRN